MIVVSVIGIILAFAVLIFAAYKKISMFLAAVLAAAIVALFGGLDAIRQDAEAEMDEAVKFADASPYPDPATVLDDMYVTDNERCVAR